MNSLELFRHKPVLSLLVLPAALLLWSGDGRRGVSSCPSTTPPRRHAPWMLFFLRLAESMPAAAPRARVLLIAGPQTWETPRSKRVLTNIEFCVDVSGSMTSKFGEGDRYEAAMKAINDFLDVRKGDAYGLTFFGNNVLHWVPLTTDVSALPLRAAVHAPAATCPCGSDGTRDRRRARTAARSCSSARRATA
jgi:Ca-activated chloride channel family protein